MDEDGKETYCSLCGEGGSVVCCDSCEKTVCFACVSRISGASVLELLIDSSNEEEWLCYCCDPAPLASHKALATSLLQLLGAGKNEKATPRGRRKRPASKSKEFVSNGWLACPSCLIVYGSSVSCIYLMYCKLVSCIYLMFCKLVLNYSVPKVSRTEYRSLLVQ